MQAKRIPLLFASPATGPTSGTAPARWRAAYGRAALHGRAIRAQHHYAQPRAARDSGRACRLLWRRILTARGRDVRGELFFHGQCHGAASEN